MIKTNVCVFSDNPYMARTFKEIANKLIPDMPISYFCSKYSNPIEFRQLNVIKLDIKKDYKLLLNDFTLIFSMHCKQIFPKELIEKVKCINIHPGYNPINRGWYPQVFSIINNTVIGATIHEMDSELDHGNIIARKKVAKYIWDTSETLYKRIVKAEIELLKHNIESILNNKYSTFRPENEGFLFLKEDFNQLCKLNLSKKGSYGEFINHLRALSHGTHKNAYFLDKETGKKIYVKIDLNVETLT